MAELKTNFPVDLHCHTVRSDGADTPKELIDHAAELGMEIIAITDHDVRPPETIEVDGKQISLEQYAAMKGVKVLPGIEVSCETTVEDCHIVCLGCDWSDPWFDQLEQDVIDSKIDGYRQLVEAMADAGLDVSWQEVLENDGNPVPEEQVQKKMIFELMARKGCTASWSDAKLLVKNTPAFQIQRRKPDPIDVIKNAHRCGGIAIMAHPFLTSDTMEVAGEKMDRPAYIKRLVDAGLDGMEARYAYEKTSYAGALSSEEIAAWVRDNYAGKLFISGGSDYHADAKKGAKKVRELGECGLTMEEFNSSPILKAILAR